MQTLSSRPERVSAQSREPKMQPSPTRGPWVPDIRWHKFRDDIREQLPAGIASLQLRADY
jgi:hypothetical protein